jgi:hypothetical protein
MLNISGSQVASASNTLDRSNCQILPRRAYAFFTRISSSESNFLVAKEFVCLSEKFPHPSQVHSPFRIPIMYLPSYPSFHSSQRASVKGLYWFYGSSRENGSYIQAVGFTLVLLRCDIRNALIQ